MPLVSASRHVALATLVLLAVLPACRSVSETRALRGVDFHLAGVQDAVLAGVDLDRIESVDDLRSLPRSSAAVVAAGLLRGSLPLRFSLVVGARNPETNPQARLTRFDWTLFLDDQEVSKGTVERGPTIAPGDSATFLVPVSVDLVEVTGNNAAELARMALAVAGRRADPSRVRVEARPYVDTPLGQIPLKSETVVARAVGGRPEAPAGSAEAQP